MKDATNTTSWLKARNILVVLLLLHFINNFYWLKDGGFLSHGCHSAWLEEKAFIFSEVLGNDNLSIPSKFFQTVNLLRLSQGGYSFQATNFNLTSLLIAGPIATSLDGYVKLFLIHLILFGLFLFVLLAVYYLGKCLFNPTIGAWSAIILSFYPGIIGLSRIVNSELLVTALLVFSVTILIRWEHIGGFRRLPLLIIVFILGVLSGGLYLVFFVPLFLLHSILCLFSYTQKKRHLIELVVFLVFTAIFLHISINGEYARFFLNLKSGLIEAYNKLTCKTTTLIGSGADGRARIFLFSSQEAVCPCTQTTNIGLNLKTFLFYILESLRYCSVVLFLLAAVSVVFVLISKKVDFIKKAFFGVWILAGYMLLTLFHIKWAKFITPALPALALSTGIFTCKGLRKPGPLKIILICLGAATVLYYSYVRPSQKHFLEDLNENIIAHRPYGSHFAAIAEQCAAKMNSDTAKESGDYISIAFIDQASVRFRSAWVTDLSKQIENLIRLFLKKKYTISDFWSLSDNFYDSLAGRDFVILINNEPLTSVDSYLYPHNIRKDDLPRSRIIYEAQLAKAAYIYLVKIIK